MGSLIGRVSSWREGSVKVENENSKAKGRFAYPIREDGRKGGSNSSEFNANAAVKLEPKRAGFYARRVAGYPRRYSSSSAPGPNRGYRGWFDAPLAAAPQGLPLRVDTARIC